MTGETAYFISNHKWFKLTEGSVGTGWVGMRERGGQREILRDERIMVRGDFRRSAGKAKTSAAGNVTDRAFRKASL